MTCRTHARGHPTEGCGTGIFTHQLLSIAGWGCCCFWVVFIPWHKSGFPRLWKKALGKGIQRLTAGGQLEHMEVLGWGVGAGPPQHLQQLHLSKNSCHCHNVVLAHKALRTLRSHSWVLSSNKSPVPGTGTFIQLENNFAEKSALFSMIPPEKELLLWNTKPARDH